MGGRNHHAKNCNFSANKHPSDIRPVVKLEFVHGGPEEKPVLGHNRERHNPEDPQPGRTQPRRDTTRMRQLDELTRKTSRLINLFVPLGLSLF